MNTRIIVREPNYLEIRSLIEGMKDIFGEFRYIGLNHRVVHMKEVSETTPANYTFPNEQVDGVEIDIWKNADLRFAKPIILHAFTEWLARERFRRAKGPWFHAYEPGSKAIAHKTATQFDERYAQEIFDESLLKDYLAYKNSLEKSITCHF